MDETKYRLFVETLDGRTGYVKSPWGDGDLLVVSYALAVKMAAERAAKYRCAVSPTLLD